MLFKLDELVRPYCHKILVVIEPLLIDEDYYARVEGRHVVYCAVPVLHRTALHWPALWLWPHAVPRGGEGRGRCGRQRTVAEPCALPLRSPAAAACTPPALPRRAEPLPLAAPPAPPRREIIANLAKAAGLATMIAAMRPDIDNVDEYVRNTTARAFSGGWPAAGLGLWGGRRGGVVVGPGWQLAGMRGMQALPGRALLYAPALRTAGG